MRSNFRQDTKCPSLPPYTIIRIKCLLTIIVAFYLLEGNPPTPGWSQTNLRMVTQRRKCTTDLNFGTYTLHINQTPGDNCHGSVLQTWNFAFTLYSPNYVTTCMNSHIPSQGWRPTHQMVVTHQHEVLHPPGICVIKTGNLEHRLNPQKYHWVTTTLVS